MKTDIYDVIYRPTLHTRQGCVSLNFHGASPDISTKQPSENFLCSCETISFRQDRRDDIFQRFLQKKKKTHSEVVQSVPKYNILLFCIWKGMSRYIYSKKLLFLPLKLCFELKLVIVSSQSIIIILYLISLANLFSQLIVISYDHFYVVSY